MIFRRLVTGDRVDDIGRVGIRLVDILGPQMRRGEDNRIGHDTAIRLGVVNPVVQSRLPRAGFTRNGKVGRRHGECPRGVAGIVQRGRTRHTAKQDKVRLVRRGGVGRLGHRSQRGGAVRIEPRIDHDVRRGSDSRVGVLQRQIAACRGIEIIALCLPAVTGVALINPDHAVPDTGKHIIIRNSIAADIDGCRRRVPVDRHLPCQAATGKAVIDDRQRVRRLVHIAQDHLERLP